MLFKKENRKDLENRVTDLEDTFNALTDYLDVNVIKDGYTVKDKSLGFKVRGEKK